MYLEDGGIQLRLDALNENEWIIRNVDTNETRRSTSLAIIEAVQSKRLRIVPQGEGSKTKDSGHGTSSNSARLESPKALAVLDIKRQWIDALRQIGVDKFVDQPWIRAAMNKLASGPFADMPRYSIRTLGIADRKVRAAGGDWTKAIPQYSSRGGRGGTRTDPRAEDVIRTVLDVAKGETGRFVRNHLHDRIRARILELNHATPDAPISMPGATTIDRRISETFTKFDIAIRNSTRKSAVKLFRQNSFPRDRAQYPLAVSEYDDIDTGVFLISEKLGLPVGRAYLTHGIDQATRVPLGSEIGHRPRSYESAIGAICDSLLPKDPTRAEFQGIAGDWIGFGAQGTIVMDNARQNFSTYMRMTADTYRLVLAGARPYGPTEKQTIEYYNHIVKRDFCSSLPGWRGDKNDPESIKHAMSTSCIDEATFRRLYAQWVVGVYLNMPGDDGLTPKQRWMRFYKDHTPAVRWTREEVAFMRLRPTDYRFRASGGIKRLGLVYDGPELSSLRMEIGHKANVIVYVNDRDLRQIQVLHPRTKQLMHVPCVQDERYISGLTSYQQSLILKMARESKIKNPSLVEMVQARERLMEVVEQSRRSTKLRKRQASERIGEVPTISIMPAGPAPLPNQTQPTHVKREVVATDLEWSIRSLEQIDLDPQDGEW
jgi:putative transposase